MKFSIAIEKFIRLSEGTYAPKTLEVYVLHMRKFQEFIGDKDIEEVKLFDDIIKWREILTGRQFTDGTINLAMISLRQLFKKILSVERELDIRLPFVWTAIPQQRVILPNSYKPIEQEDHLKLIKAIGGMESFKMARDTAILQMLYDTGVRVSELTALDVSSLDLVEQSAQVVTRKRRDKVKKRVVFWTRETAIALGTYLDMRQHAVTGVALFVNMINGRRLTPRAIQRMMKEYAETAGLDPTLFKPHGYRHGLGMRSAGAEMYPPVLSDLLGHTSVQSTKFYYNLKNPMRQKEYHDKVGDTAKMHAISKKALEDERAFTVAK